MHFVMLYKTQIYKFVYSCISKYSLFYITAICKRTSWKNCTFVAYQNSSKKFVW